MHLSKLAAKLRINYAAYLRSSYKNQKERKFYLNCSGCVLDKEKVTKGVTAAMQDDSKGIYWVAKFEGRTIGSLMITQEWSDWNNEWYWWIQSVYVIPEFRKQGVYKAMLNCLYRQI